ncbi:MAG: hypothetical protein IKN63_04780 [Bacilli bacterium]|nr:hypothetical protein [Bacillota bacterium]MBR3661191.1 hypothetical protein [Bacilli bacterium]
MIEELSTKVTDFYYDYDPYEFKDNYENYNEGLEATQEVLSSKSETKKLISDLEQINDDLYGDNDPIIKEFYDRSYSLINDLNEYQKTLKEDYEL